MHARSRRRTVGTDGDHCADAFRVHVSVRVDAATAVLKSDQVLMSPDAKLQLAIAQPDPPESPFYIPATVSATRPRRALKHGDTFIVVDSHGDIGASAGRLGRALSRRHALPVAARTAAERRAAFAARLERARRQHAARGRPDQSRHLRRRPDRPAEGHPPRRTHDLPVERHRLSAHQGAQSRTEAGRGLAFAALRQRLRRPVRGARRAPRATRHDFASRDRRQAAGAAQLQGARRRVAAHDAHLRPAAGRTDRAERDLPLRSRAARGAADLPARELPRGDRRSAGAVPARPARRASRIAPRARTISQRSRPRTATSTRCCAAPPPISTC